MSQSVNNEEWLPVLGFEKSYEVSSLGRVKSLDRLVPHHNSSTGMALRRGKILSPSRSSKYGHLKIKLGGGSVASQVSYHVHQLVLSAFVGPRPAGMEVRHLNGDPSDNRLENLAYGTRKDNANDMRLHGTDKTRALRVSESKQGIATVWCERHGMAKLTVEQVKSMKKDFTEGMTATEACRKYNISQAHASKIRLGQAWARLELL